MLSPTLGLLVAGSHKQHHGISVAEVFIRFSYLRMRCVQNVIRPYYLYDPVWRYGRANGLGMCARLSRWYWDCWRISFDDGLSEISYSSAVTSHRTIHKSSEALTTSLLFLMTNIEHELIVVVSRSIWFYFYRIMETYFTHLTYTCS